MLTLPVFRCVIEDSSYTAVQVNGYANLTIKNSHISGRNYGIKVSTSEDDDCLECGPGLRDSTEISKYVLVNVEDTAVSGGSYGVRCSGRAIDCHVTDCHLQMNVVQAVSCQNVRSCTVQYCTMNSSSSYELAVNAVGAQTLVVDSNIISNKTSGQVVYASLCHSVQVRFLYF